MFWVYMLKCADESYYIGHTEHLKKRVTQHESGALAGYTFSRRPVILVYAEHFPTRIEALEMERRIKGWSRGKKAALAAGDWKLVSALSRKRFL